MSYSAAVGLLTSIKLLTGIGLTAISEQPAGWRRIWPSRPRR